MNETVCYNIGNKPFHYMRQVVSLDKTSHWSNGPISDSA